MEIREYTDKNISELANILRSGQLIGMPTETVYGLAASIYSENALQNIFSLKQRPMTDPLIVHVADV